MELNKDISFLVVDDFEPMRKLISGNLSEIGYIKIAQAQDGQEAVQYLQKHRVDCIISDWNMPHLMGIDLLRYVRSEPRHSHTCFMMITGESERQMVNTAIAEGVDQFLIKPFTTATLRNKVSDMLTRGPRRPSLTTAKSDVKTAAAVSQESKAQILVVDDTPENIDVIVGALKESYRVKAAKDGRSALKIARGDRQPDLILLDIMMPEMDGYEVCRQLKADPSTSAIPVIFLSARSETPDMTKGFELGAEDYITKPADIAVLKARVAAHLRLKSARDELEERIDTLMDNVRLREDVERITRHDLKSPLAVIMGTAESILSNQWSTADQKQRVKPIYNASVKMLEMINLSLDIYKMETGSYLLKPAKVNVTELLMRVVDEFRTDARRKNIKILFSAPDECFADVEELLCFSMFGNLLKNAIEASAESAEVNVSIVKGDTALDSDIRVAIRNPGFIPSEIRETLFDKYVTSGKNGGTGLGAYSAKLIAEAHHGDIQVSSDNIDGTTFEVTLPVNQGCSE